MDLPYEPDELIDLLLADAYTPPSSDSHAHHRAAESVIRDAARDPQRLEPTDSSLREQGEQLVYELDLTSTLVLGDAKAAAVLARLMDTEPEPEGALVFGCLLHLVGLDMAARFWWRFASGAGIHLGAYCLYLRHAGTSDYDQARHWLSEWKQLRADRQPTSSGAEPAGPLLPEPVYHELLEQCRRGQHPRLPLGIEIAVNQLAPDDTDFRNIPQPSPELASVICTPA
jgi:hypothetical protein